MIGCDKGCFPAVLWLNALLEKDLVISKEEKFWQPCNFWSMSSCRGRGYASSWSLVLALRKSTTTRAYFTPYNKFWIGNWRGLAQGNVFD